MLIWNWAKLTKEIETGFLLLTLCQAQIQVLLLKGQVKVVWAKYEVGLVWMLDIAIYAPSIVFEFRLPHTIPCRALPTKRTIHTLNIFPLPHLCAPRTPISQMPPT